MANQAVLQSLNNGVNTLTLNQPENKNALSVELVNQLGDLLTESIQDEATRVIVLTNTENTFCAGADLKAKTNESPKYSLVELFELIQTCPKPIVGLINGHCMGGGVGLAAACDISIMNDQALLGFTEVRIGVAPAIISVVCLPKMRRADAMELFLSGERISAQRAVEVGLINYSVAPAELDTKLEELVGKLIKGGPRALTAAKRLVVDVPQQDSKTAFEWTAKLSSELFHSEEAAEGIAAFRERRVPNWVPSQKK